MLSSITGGLGTAGGIVAHGLHGAIGELVPAVPFTHTAPERTARIAAEMRSIAIASESRTVFAGRESRITRVEREARSVVVAIERRQI